VGISERIGFIVFRINAKNDVDGREGVKRKEFSNRGCDCHDILIVCLAMTKK